MRRAAVIALLPLMVACGQDDPVDEAIQRHADHPGMVELLEAGKPYESPTDVDKAAGYFTVACIGIQLGAPESAAKTREKIAKPPWGVELSLPQAEALHDALPAYCAQQN